MTLGQVKDPNGVWSAACFFHCSEFYMHIHTVCTWMCVVASLSQPSTCCDTCQLQWETPTGPWQSMESPWQMQSPRGMDLNILSRHTLSTSARASTAANTAHKDPSLMQANSCSNKQHCPCRLSFMSRV